MKEKDFAQGDQAQVGREERRGEAENVPLMERKVGD